MLFYVFLILNLLAYSGIGVYALFAKWDRELYKEDFDGYLFKLVKCDVISMVVGTFQVITFTIHYAIDQNIIKNCILCFFILLSLAICLIFIKKYKNTIARYEKEFLARCEQISNKYNDYINHAYFRHWIDRTLNSSSIGYNEAFEFLSRYEIDMDKKLKESK